MRSLSPVVAALLAAPLSLAAPASAPATVTVTVTVVPTTVISEKFVYTVTVPGSCPTPTSYTTTTATTTPTTSVSATTTSLNTDPYPTSTLLGSDTQGLNDLAKATGKVYFGTAADIPGPELSDVGYMTVLNNTHEFGQLTPANYMKVSCQADCSYVNQV